MSKRAEEVARAVLYEGYILYPYRPSSVKNQQRWNFGVVSPPGSAEGASTIETQCLIEMPSATAEIDIRIRFLHLTDRTIARRDERGEVFHPVQKAECEGRIFQPWQEAVEREVVITGWRPQEGIVQSFDFAASRTTEPVRDASGATPLLILREQQALKGLVEASSEPAGENLRRLTIRVSNLTTPPGHRSSIRDGLLLHSFASAHTILKARGAMFISLIDPPEACREAAANCRNTGTFPVLVGEEGQRDVMLSSPIILYDYPQVAPESAGDLCDATEIDEILSLRILTLTDEEKREMRQADPYARAILDRTESMPEEQWMKLHGVLRALRPTTEISQ